MNNSLNNSAEGLLPLLQPAKWFEDLAAFDLEAPAHQPFVAGLSISYVLDLSEYIVSLDPDVVQQFVGQFDPPIERVHQVAIENLRARTSDEDYTINGDGDQITIVCDIQDKFAASRLLLPDLLAAWSAHIPGNMLLGIPHRDYLIAFSDRDPDHVEIIAERLQSDSDSQGYALYDGLLLWDNGKIQEYHP